MKVSSIGNPSWTDRFMWVVEGVSVVWRDLLVGLGLMDEGCEAESSSVLMLLSSMLFVLVGGGILRFGDVTEMSVGGLVTCS